jgi:hypothetical protein
MPYPLLILFDKLTRVLHQLHIMMDLWIGAPQVIDIIMTATPKDFQYFGQSIYGLSSGVYL